MAHLVGRAASIGNLTPSCDTAGEARASLLRALHQRGGPVVPRSALRGTPAATLLVPLAPGPSHAPALRSGRLRLAPGGVRPLARAPSPQSRFLAVPELLSAPPPSGPQLFP